VDVVRERDGTAKNFEKGRKNTERQKQIYFFI
jgi:hypothetical protein